MRPRAESSSVEDLRRELGLILKRLDALEDVIVLGNKVYMRVPSERVEELEESKGRVFLDVKLVLEPRKAKVGETVGLSVHVSNLGDKPVFLTRIERVLPEGFELIAKPDDCSQANGWLDVERRKIVPSKTEEIELTLKAFFAGTFEARPKIVCVSERGQELASESESVAISVAENILPGRVSTGYPELDSLLLGGLPENYAIILLSTSCDERDSLIEKFLETGAKNQQITFYFGIDAGNAKTLAEEYQTNFYLFVCNPQADSIIKDLPNVFKIKGVENLTDINIALTSAFRRLNLSVEGPRRACVGIVSDVLLQHHAIQTRRWLTGLIPALRSRGFTTLAIINPHMHPTEEVQAVLDLFDGEINLFEKGSQKFLEIRKLHNKRYLNIELPMSKATPDFGHAATRGKWMKL